MRTLTAEQTAARNARRARFRALAKQIADMSEADRATLAAKMVGIVTVEGRTLSLHNVYMIALQNPTATLVGGFRQWLKHGRAVRKGEHGTTIWVATGHKDEQGNIDDAIRFLTGTVFDVSQTDEIGNPARA